MTRELKKNGPDLVSCAVIPCEVHLSRAAILHVRVTVMNYNGNCGLSNVKVV